ncbi:MAG: proline reductase cluster protein PrdD [Firmicutes bacterium]|nr:proline reductase cluster protein PrdD [Bacillota bacterium]
MCKEDILRKLTIKCFHIKEVEFGNKSNINDGKLILNKDSFKELSNEEDVIDEIKIHIIKPRDHDRYVNSIMDFIPISTKVLGKIGQGITHTLTGVYVMLTGADTDGKQMAEFGSSEGILNDKVSFGKSGTPSKDDYIIHCDVTLKSGLEFNRNLSLTIHRLCDNFIQDIRNILKSKDGRNADEKHEYYDRLRHGKKKVLIVKQIAGQGMMYDNQLFPNEPSGFTGGRSIIDLGNAPVIISPNEYRDGAIRAMT